MREQSQEPVAKDVPSGEHLRLVTLKDKELSKLKCHVLTSGGTDRVTDPVLVSVEHADAVGLERVPHIQCIVVVAAEQDAPRGAAEMQRKIRHYSSDFESSELPEVNCIGSKDNGLLAVLGHLAISALKEHE